MNQQAKKNESLKKNRQLQKLPLKSQSQTQKNNLDSQQFNTRLPQNPQINEIVQLQQQEENTVSQNSNVITFKPQNKYKSIAQLRQQKLEKQQKALENEQKQEMENIINQEQNNEVLQGQEIHQSIQQHNALKQVPNEENDQQPNEYLKQKLQKRQMKSQQNLLFTDMSVIPQHYKDKLKEEKSKPCGKIQDLPFEMFIFIAQYCAAQESFFMIRVNREFRSFMLGSKIIHYNNIFAAQNRDVISFNSTQVEQVKITKYFKIMENAGSKDLFVFYELLIWAIKAGNVEFVEDQIQNSFKAIILDCLKNKRTFDRFLAFFGPQEIEQVKKLFENLQTLYEENVTDFAISEDQQNTIFEYLLNKRRKYDGNSLVHLSIKFGQCEVLDYFFKNQEKWKIDLKSKNKDGYAPIHLTVKQKSLPMFNLVARNSDQLVMPVNYFQIIKHHYVFKYSKLIRKLKSQEKVPLVKLSLFNVAVMEYRILSLDFIVILQSFAVIKKIDIAKMSDEEKRETFREAKILEVLNHPNIIRFKEVYKTKRGQLCIVMDYADGGDLAGMVKRQKEKGGFLSEDQILHRDLKSQNVFLTRQGLAKLGDFGIAKVLQSTIDNAKTIVGTPYYLSPEIIENKPYNFKSDVWSLGVLLYEMCALKPPFNGGSLHILALQIVRGVYQPLPAHYSQNLKNFIGSLLSLDPTKRPNINQILKSSLISHRIKTYLDDDEFKNEFAHTILHKQNVFNKTQNNLMAQVQPQEEKPKPLGVQKAPQTKREEKPKPLVFQQQRSQPVEKSNQQLAQQKQASAYQQKMQQKKEIQEKQRQHMLGEFKELQRRKEEDERRRLKEREQKQKKLQDQQEDRLMQKQKLEEQRKQMKEDILNKKKELKGKGSGFQVEIVGLPPDMMGSGQDEQPYEESNDQDAMPYVMSQEVAQKPLARKQSQTNNKRLADNFQKNNNKNAGGFEILISDKDLERIEKRQQIPERKSVVMDEQKEAEYDDYVNLIEKVLGRQMSQSLQEEETKGGPDDFSETQALTDYINTKKIYILTDDQDAGGLDSLDNMIQQVTQDAADEEEDRDDDEEDSDSSSQTSNNQNGQDNVNDAYQEERDANEETKNFVIELHGIQNFEIGYKIMEKYREHRFGDDNQKIILSEIEASIPSLNKIIILQFFYLFYMIELRSEERSSWMHFIFDDNGRLQKGKETTMKQTYNNETQMFVTI